jgi:hypothetical protein
MFILLLRSQVSAGKKVAKLCRLGQAMAFAAIFVLGTSVVSAV